ncbi:MAG: Flp family type IVb pilin [Rhizomicrobium sp.]
MGISRESQHVPDAPGGPAAHSHAVRSALTRFVGSREGVTAVEYGILVALMTVVITSAVYYMGNTALTQLFEKVANSL